MSAFASFHAGDASLSTLLFWRFFLFLEEYKPGPKCDTAGSVLKSNNRTSAKLFQKLTTFKQFFGEEISSFASKCNISKSTNDHTCRENSGCPSLGLRKEVPMFSFENPCGRVQNEKAIFSSTNSDLWAWVSLELGRFTPHFKAFGVARKQP